MSVSCNGVLISESLESHGLIANFQSTRRIKCDETKPTCTRCATSGWKCEGYAKYQKPPPRALVPNRGSALKSTSTPVFTFITSTQPQLASMYIITTTSSIKKYYKKMRLCYRGVLKLNLTRYLKVKPSSHFASSYACKSAYLNIYFTISQ